MNALVEPSYGNLTTLTVGFVCLFFYSVIIGLGLGLDLNYIQIIVFVIQKLFLSQYFKLLGSERRQNALVSDPLCMLYSITEKYLSHSLLQFNPNHIFSKQIANVNAKTQLTSKRMTPQPLHPPANMCFTISILNMISGHHLDYCKVANAFVIQ